MAAMQMQASAMKAAFLLPSAALLLFSKCPQLSILYLYLYIIPYYRAKNDSVTIG